MSVCVWGGGIGGVSVCKCYCVKCTLYMYLVDSVMQSEYLRFMLCFRLTSNITLECAIAQYHNYNHVIIHCLSLSLSPLPN